MKLKILALLTFFLSSVVFASSFAEQETERYYQRIKSDPKKLFSFLLAMPKGGDLHNHKNGATYAENLLMYARDDHFCIDPKTFIVSENPNCAIQNLLNNAIQNLSFRDALIDAWSMRHFKPGNESGHHHFFKAFEKFGLISHKHSGEILAEVVERAADQQEIYLELMETADGDASGRLGEKLGYDADFNNMRTRLLANGFDQIITTISQNLNKDEAKMRELLHCDSKYPKPGCHIKVRYLYQVLREQSPEMVFAQLLAGFEAAQKDARLVGVNMVQPEDGKISMRDYELHMQMVGYLKTIYPNVKVSLHAGELTKAVVADSGLKFHINDAVNIAHSNRIGHGVDIAREDNMEELLKTMHDKKILVEINLTSNAYILDVENKNHPLLLYIRHGVPVTLSTDDEGVNRSTLTGEYKRAVLSYDFPYFMLKNMARNSISYSFLPGENLWQDNQYHVVHPACAKDNIGAAQYSAACKIFLDSNEKAAMQWKLENSFNNFERQYRD